MKISQVLSASILLAFAGAPLAVFSGDSKVMITPQIEAVKVELGDRKVTISRHQDPKHQIDEVYAKTSRACPPFCIQPMRAAEGVETIGELEMLEYLKKASGDSVLVIDSRTSDWLARGTIPGSVNIPWTKLSMESATAFDIQVADTLDGIMQEHFKVSKDGDDWNFDKAKTLVLFCNGIWCPQSSSNIHALLKQGYPAEKLKWYRGGMQSWESVGLTVLKPGQ